MRMERSHCANEFLHTRYHYIVFHIPYVRCLSRSSAWVGFKYHLRHWLNSDWHISYSSYSQAATVHRQSVRAKLSHRFIVDLFLEGIFFDFLLLHVTTVVLFYITFVSQFIQYAHANTTLTHIQHMQKRTRGK